MQRERLLRLCKRLMVHPAIAYHEHEVRTEAETICREHGLPLRHDRFGNLLVEVNKGVGRPVVLSAHLDHPGFEILAQTGPKTWTARFRGGVADEYFRAGVPVCLMPGRVAARLGKRLGEAKEFELRLANGSMPKHEPTFAVWDLPEFSVRSGRIVGRACDDLIGVSSVLATLIDLKESGSQTHVIGAITRAEEVGFHGALTLANSRVLPQNALIVSLETSKEMPPVKMGKGVILRVGDKASIFDSAGTRFLAEVGTELTGAQKGFGMQRALMSGGTCEATAYQEFGYASVGVCLALGNYHNCGGGKRIEAEYVSVADCQSMVELLVQAAQRINEFQGLTGRLPERLRTLLAEAERELPGSQ